MPNCLVVQHVAPEGAFAIAEALESAGIAVTTCRIFAGDTLPPDVGGLDGLVVMGGPMSANSDDGFDSRPAELARLAEAVAGRHPHPGHLPGRPAARPGRGRFGHARAGRARDRLGIGRADGTSPRPTSSSPTCRPGWSCCSGTATPSSRPRHAVRLAGNAAYPNQAFRIGPAAWDLQFHVEVDAGAVDGFLTAFGHDAEDVDGGPDAIRAATPAALEQLAPTRDRLLGRFAQLVQANVTRGDLVGS